MKPLAGKHIVLGVTGGIAAYKSAELVRRLRDWGAGVQVIMTHGAREFITPLTFQALSGNTVHKNTFDGEGQAMDHIGLARQADLILIAPATADRMARMAHGMADDLLGTVCLATTAPIAIVPAMNQQMWLAPATQANLARLREYGQIVLGPAEGDQACGETGPGRMLEPQDIATRVRGLFVEPILKGLSLLITAGPTREVADPVRFLTNASSGRMGHEIARAGVEAGASVTLVTGPVALENPAGVQRVQVTGAREMQGAVMDHLPGKDIFIAAAAVSDYRPATYTEEKQKKGAARMELSLERNPDVLAGVTAMPEHPFAVGFAAETHDVERNALDKLRRKSLDMIAANHVGGTEIGFQSGENALTVYWEGGKMEIPRASKWAVSHRLLSLVAERYRKGS